MFKDEIESLRKQLEENQKEMAALEESWQQRLEAERQKVSSTTYVE